MKPFLLEPIPDFTIWGSNRISKVRNKEKNYGTWWEVSAHDYCSNPIKETTHTLLEMIQTNPEEVLGPGYTLHETLRLAYLDTQDALSIQVHPQDEYAIKHSHDYGKYESWYILEAAKGATLVAGTNTKDADTIKRALNDHTLDKYLRKWPVQKGDYITIPAGMLHALGRDILALEVGTNSNTTYRFYDYNRKDLNGNTRPLHLKESFDVTDFSLEPTFVPAANTSHCLSDNPYFKVDEIYAKENIELACKEHYCIISNVDKETTIIWNDEEIKLPYLDSIFIPYAAKKVILTKGSHVLLSNPKKGN